MSKVVSQREHVGGIIMRIIERRDGAFSVDPILPVLEPHVFWSVRSGSIATAQRVADAHVAAWGHDCDRVGCEGWREVAH